MVASCHNIFNMMLLLGDTKIWHNYPSSNPDVMTTERLLTVALNLTSNKVNAWMSVQPQSDQGSPCPFAKSLINVDQIDLHVYTKVPF